MIGLIVGDQAEEPPEVKAGDQDKKLKPLSKVGEVELSLFKRIVLRLSGAVYVGHHKTRLKRRPPVLRLQVPGSWVSRELSTGPSWQARLPALLPERDGLALGYNYIM